MRDPRHISTFAGLMVVALVGCGPSKPSGSEYLGKWDITTKGGIGLPVECRLNISQNGESFLISDATEDKSWHQVCGKYDGIYTMTPEGNLKGPAMGMPLMSFDKVKNQVIVSGGGELEYLRKVP